jgi:hypothetical protein
MCSSKAVFIIETQNITIIQYVGTMKSLICIGISAGGLTVLRLLDGCLVGCCAVQSGRSLPTFQRYLLPP